MEYTVQSQTFETIQLKYTPKLLCQSHRDIFPFTRIALFFLRILRWGENLGQKPASIEWDDIFSIQLDVHNLPEQLRATFSILYYASASY